jgi:hypothetical protein
MDAAVGAAVMGAAVGAAGMNAAVHSNETKEECKVTASTRAHV